MKHIPMVKPIMGFQKRPKDGAESTLCSNMSTGLVDIYEIKRSQRHLWPLSKTTKWFRLLCQLISNALP